MTPRRPCILLLALGVAGTLLGGRAGAQGSDSRIAVHADRVVNRVSPWMYGSCIEDVNHEIYGGLYAQMLFGESFEEPPAAPPIPGWTRYGGEWRAGEGQVSVQPDFGAKLVWGAGEIGDATVSCQVRFDAPGGDNAGLILRVRNPRTGADTWTGYEVSLSLLNQYAILGRHRENWTPLKTAPVHLEAGKWYALAVEMNGARLRVLVDGAPVLQYEDTAAPILTGAVGLRTWGSAASFRAVGISHPGEVGIRGHHFRPPADDPLAGVSGMWDRIRTGSAGARFGWDMDRPLNTASSQRIEVSGGGGTAGVANRGLNRWGITVREGHRYDGRVYLRGRGYTGKVTVALQSADGSRTYAAQRIGGIGTDWKRCPFSLRPSDTDTNARFAVWIDEPGTVWVDQAVLMPTGRELFHGLPVRADIGEGLARQGLTFLRYGGSMVNAAEYRWKKMLGDPDRRPQYRGWWYPYSSNGFGIEEFVRFCEAAYIEPAFAINIDETAQDAGDLVEYLNGPATSPWGRKRAENGHPEPYGVRYIEVGNEEAINGDRAWYTRYLDRFQQLYAAMHAVDPRLQFVIAAWWKPEEPLVRRIIQELNGKAALWDVHVGGDKLQDGRAVDRTFTQMERLFQEWAPGTHMKAAVFEENGGRHDLQRALGHVSILNATARHGDFVRMDCPANCLQPWRQNDNGWDQGQLFFTSSQVWGMPPYYAQQISAAAHQARRTAVDAASPNDDLDVVALRDAAGKRLTLRVVNLGAQAHTALLTLERFHATKRARVSQLKGELTAANSPEEPERVVPTTAEWHGGSGDTYPFPPHSITVLEFR